MDSLPGGIIVEVPTYYAKRVSIIDESGRGCCCGFRLTKYMYEA